jgi:hypothetical protein
MPLNKYILIIAIPCPLKKNNIKKAILIWNEIAFPFAFKIRQNLSLFIINSLKTGGLLIEVCIHRVWNNIHTFSTHELNKTFILGEVKNYYNRHGLSRCKSYSSFLILHRFLCHFCHPLFLGEKWSLNTGWPTLWAPKLVVSGRVKRWSLNRGEL